MVRYALLMSLAMLPAGVAAAHAATETFHARLDAASEVPPTTSHGHGEATVTLDTTTRQVRWNVTYSGLTGPATMAHIHGPAAPGKNADVLVSLGEVTGSPIDGTATVTPGQVDALEAGKTYVNIHTAANPGGEIRGQLTK